jgi:translation initiation factor 2 gamma subunit (eIF-2gamma)
VSEKKELYSDVKGQMRLSERIAAFIPGFRGYKEKELRRESDKLLRNHLSLKLSTAKTDLRDIFQKLSDRRYFDVLTDMDRLVAKMDRVVGKINHASYGYTGFFDAVKVNEEALDRMITFDDNLVDEIEAVTSAIAAFKADLASGETKNIKPQIQNVTAKLEGLENTFDQREEVILGVN